MHEIILVFSGLMIGAVIGFLIMSLVIGVKETNPSRADMFRYLDSLEIRHRTELLNMLVDEYLYGYHIHKNPEKSGGKDET